MNFPCLGAAPDHSPLIEVGDAGPSVQSPAIKVSTPRVSIWRRFVRLLCHFPTNLWALILWGLASVKYKVYARQNAQFLAFGGHSFPAAQTPPQRQEEVTSEHAQKEEDPTPSPKAEDSLDGPADWDSAFNALATHAENGHGLPTHAREVHLFEHVIENFEHGELVCPAAKKIIQQWDKHDPDFPKIAWTLLQLANARRDIDLVGELLNVWNGTLCNVYMWMVGNSADDLIEELCKLTLKLPPITLFPILIHNPRPEWTAFAEKTLRQLAEMVGGEIPPDLLCALFHIISGYDQPMYTPDVLVYCFPKSCAELVHLLVILQIRDFRMRYISMLGVWAEKTSVVNVRPLLQYGTGALGPDAAMSLMEMSDGEKCAALLFCSGNSDPAARELLLLLMERALTGDPTVAQRLRKVVLDNGRVLRNVTNALIEEGDIKYEFAFRIFRLLATLGESTALFADEKNCKKIKLAEIIALLLKALTVNGSLDGEASTLLFEIAQKADPKYNLPFGVYRSLAKEPAVGAAFLERVGEIYPKLVPGAKAVLCPATGDGSDGWNKFIGRLKGSPSPASP